MIHLKHIEYPNICFDNNWKISAYEYQPAKPEYNEPEYAAMRYMYFLEPYFTPKLNPVDVFGSNINQITIHIRKFDLTARFYVNIHRTNDKFIVPNSEFRESLTNFFELRFNVSYTVVKAPEDMNNLTLFEETIEQIRTGVFDIATLDEWGIQVLVPFNSEKARPNSLLSRYEIGQMVANEYKTGLLKNTDYSKLAISSTNLQRFVLEPLRDINDRTVYEYILRFEGKRFQTRLVGCIYKDRNFTIEETFDVEVFVYETRENEYKIIYKNNSLTNRLGFELNFNVYEAWPNHKLFEILVIPKGNYMFELFGTAPYDVTIKKYGKNVPNITKVSQTAVVDLSLLNTFGQNVSMLQGVTKDIPRTIEKDKSTLTMIDYYKAFRDAFNRYNNPELFKQEIKYLTGWSLVIFENNSTDTTLNDNLSSKFFNNLSFNPLTDFNRNPKTKVLINFNVEHLYLELINLDTGFYAFGKIRPNGADTTVTWYNHLDTNSVIKATQIQETDDKKFLSNELYNKLNTLVASSEQTTWLTPVNEVSNLIESATVGSRCVVLQNNVVYKKTNTGWIADDSLLNLPTNQEKNTYDVTATDEPILITEKELYRLRNSSMGYQVNDDLFVHKSTNRNRYNSSYFNNIVAIDHVRRTDSETIEVGNSSINFGFGNRLNKDYDITIGSSNTNVNDNHSYSIVIGNGLKKTNEQILLGKFNELSSENVFAIGNGVDDSNRSNLFAIDANGNLIIKGYIKSSTLSQSSGIKLLSSDGFIDANEFVRNSDLGNVVGKNSLIQYRHVPLDFTGTEEEELELPVLLTDGYLDSQN